MSSAFKFLLIVLAAIVLAIGARIFYINSLTPAEKSDPPVRVRIAAADLPTGLLLRDSDLSWQQMPESKVPKHALLESSDQSVLVGSLLRHQVASGAILKDSDVIQPDVPGFLAAALKPGMVAVSVSINNVSGNAGLIQPGDYVDMILTQRLGKHGDFGGSEQQVVSETVVQQVRVIAVGSRFNRGADKADPIKANTVTFEAKPRVAEAITVASELGSLSLALRSFARTDTSMAAQDTETSVTAWGHGQAQTSGPIWGGDVSRARQGSETSAQATDAPVVQDQEPASAPVIVRGPARVTVLRGTESETVELRPDAN